MADNILTLTLNLCDQVPEDGYLVFYRPLGTSGEYRTAGPFTTSPFVINDSTDPEGTLYEGYVRADCGGTLGPKVYFNDGLGCGNGTDGTYEPLDYHIYPDIFLKLLSTIITSVHILWNCYDRPNKFTVYNVTDAVQVVSTDWVGNAAYAGPWGASLLTALTGDLSFVPVVGKIYKIVVEAGGAPELNDNWDFLLNCGTE